MTDALTTLFFLGVSGTALGLLLMLLRRTAGKRLPGVFYHLAWLVVLLRFVVPLPGLVPVRSASAPSYIASSTEVARPFGAAQPVSGLGNDGDIVRVKGNTGAADADAVKESAPAPVSESPSAARAAVSWADIKSVLLSPRLWGAVWLAGALISAARNITGYRRFVRTVRRTEREPTDADLALYFSMPGARKPGLVRSRCVSSPMLMGVLRPTLVLPGRDYTPDMLTNIFRHELTHYRRGDIVYKWFAALVFSVHWFNPLAPLFRRELDRVCELSCDEYILRDMSRAEMQSYGETLLALASRRPMQSSAFVTSFATQKRDLKERLEQIMSFRPKGRASLALVLAAVLLLAGCGAALGPNGGTPSPAPSSDGDGRRLVTASTVDELLSAIASDTVITLSPGKYDLTSAADYGAAASGNYAWSEVYDGYELKLSNIKNLVIKSDGAEIVTTPRYANVVSLSSCTGVTLDGLTLGHTVEPGYCAGNVVHVDGSADVTVSSCGLYGCGVVGVFAVNSQHVFVTGSDIYDCSQNAVIAHSCRDVRVTDCRVYDCGNADYASDIFYAESTTALAVVNCEITGNSARSLMGLTYSIDCVLLGTEVRDNSFIGALLDLHTANDLAVCLTADGCEFDVPAAVPMYSEGSSSAVDTSGAELTDAALRAMMLEKAEYTGPAAVETPAVEASLGADGRREVHVKTVDEFLSAIAPDTAIYLDAELFDLSAATNYGGYGSDYYYWENNADGPGLIITGVDGLSISASSGTTIAAIPRYADVLEFKACSNISLSGFTAGHTEEPGACSGGVLYFDECSNISIDACRLYGCGIVGISTANSSGLTVSNTEIYDCSSSAVQLDSTTGVSFTGCDIHDCGTPEIYVFECSGVSYDGQALENGEYTIIDGVLSSAERQPGASTLKIYYNGEPVEQFTMHLGDTVMLTAAYDDGTVPENLIWLSSPETVLQLSYKDGSCEATATQTAESGALILLIDADTAISGAPRPSATVYVVP